MDVNQRKSIGNVYQFKKNLLNDIIYIENKKDLVKDKDNYETAGYILHQCLSRCLQRF